MPIAPLWLSREQKSRLGWPGRGDGGGGGGAEAQPRQLLFRHPAARQPRDRRRAYLKSKFNPVPGR